MSMPAASASTARADRFAEARAVADAVLYEGNVLYPYRASARKNQLRWQFGVLAPRQFADAERSEAWTMRAECVVETGRAPTELLVRVRFLQLKVRRVEEALPKGGYRTVPSLEVAGRLFTTWDESCEHEIEIGPVAYGSTPVTEFHLDGSMDVEQLCDDAGAEAGRLVRESWPLNGRVLVQVTPFGFGLSKLSVEVQNVTDWRGPGNGRDDVVRRSLVAVHILMALDEGAFISLIDPPERARAAVAECASSGCFPVLVGSPERDDLVLASPIILYDHPEIAPESPGDMCDATEIDEILALRTLTLTEEEKREARATDPRSAAIIDRVDDLPPEIFERLHGAIRSLRPAAPTSSAAPTRSVPSGPVAMSGSTTGHLGEGFDDFPTIVGGGGGGVPTGAGRSSENPAPWWDPGVDASVDPTSDRVIVGRHDVGRGSRVRLHPRRGADAQDIFLAGRTAMVAGVFHDVDGDVHLAVTIDDDPAAEMHEWYGRYRYFRPDEIEFLAEEPS